MYLEKTILPLLKLHLADLNKPCYIFSWSRLSTLLRSPSLHHFQFQCWFLDNRWAGKKTVFPLWTSHSFSHSTTIVLLLLEVPPLSTHHRTSRVCPWMHPVDRPDPSCGPFICRCFFPVEIHGSETESIRHVSMCLMLVSYLWRFKLARSRQMGANPCLCSLHARALLSVPLHMISLPLRQPPRLSTSFFLILLMLSIFTSSVNISHLLLFSVPRSLMKLLRK